MSQGGGGQTPMGYGGSQNGYGRSQFGGGYGSRMNPVYGGFQSGMQNDPQMSPELSSTRGAPMPPTNGGFTPPYQMPIFPAQQNTSEGWWSQAGRPAGGFAGMGGQTSQNDEAMRQRAMGGQQPQMSAPYSQQAPQTNQPMPTQGMAALNKPMQQPQQSFEQFAQTLNGSGMTSGQISDAYQKSIQPASTQPNFWGNVGPGGTQNPFPGNSQPFPSNWGQQTFGFDPKSMAGKTVGKDMGWYYGQDAIGRNVNNQGNAVPSFGPPADGFQRRRPWMG